MLFGRTAECTRVERLLADARGGRSGVVVVRGEPGIGKSALLAHAAERANGMTILRARGVESETELAFAGLHQALRPLFDRLELLPVPQAAALAAALGLADPGRADRFLIAAAVLSLLAQAAEERPVLCLVDDLQWLDRPSADALLFAARRIEAEPIAMILALRNGDDTHVGADGLDELALRRLGDDEAGAVVAATVDGSLSDRVRARLLEQARGNPLALVELAAAVPAGQLAGDEPLGELQLTATVERAFLGRVRALPDGSQRLLLLAASDEVGDLGTLFRAADFSESSGRRSRAPSARGCSGRKSIGVEFDHPLVRSAVYQAASFDDRQAAHRAMADALAGDEQSERRAWHRAAAAMPPDEEAAAELERAAERARRRGAHAAAAAALERSAALTAGVDARSRRLVLAAEAAWEAGAGDRARSLCEQAARLAGDPLVHGRIEHLRGTVEARRGVHARRLPDPQRRRGGHRRGRPRPRGSDARRGRHGCLVGGDLQALVAVGRRAATLRIERIPRSASTRSC